MPSPPRSGPRPGYVFLLIGVLIAALVFGADRIAAQVSERRVGAQLQTELGTPSAPQVDIEGFPFLTQAVRRSFGSVHIVADQVKAPDQPTMLAHVDLRLHDVTSADRFQTFTAARLDGTARMDYETAQTLTGQPIRYAPDGRVSVSIRTQFMAVPVTAEVVGLPEVNVADQTLTLGDPQLTVAGVTLPAGTAQSLLGTLIKPAPITGVPFGLSVQSVTAQPDGLDAAVTGEHVTFSR